MPVENIHRDGSLMFNKKVKGAAMSECVTSLFGDIHDDVEFDKEMLEDIKNKAEDVVKHWRYLDKDDAQKKKDDQEELDKLEAEAEAQRTGQVITPEQLGDSTGAEAKGQ